MFNVIKAPIIYQAVRNVEITECYWLQEAVKKGEILYGYSGVTYGCCSSSGLVVTRDRHGNEPFFEVPSDSIERIRF